MTTTTQTPTRTNVASEHLPIADVSLRKLPYPFLAGLAICNDIDSIGTLEDFLEIHRFLNTHQTTSMGPGVGLEIGNSFFFYDLGETLSYFGPDYRAPQTINELIRAGYIDCVHSYGTGVKDSQDILRAVDSLRTAGCSLSVWINHSRAKTNWSRKFEYMFDCRCQGDDPDSKYYHVNATLALGVRFAWVGATTRIMGQSAASPSPGFGTALDFRYPLRSSLNASREVYKWARGGKGDKRFTMHHHNHLMQPLELQDGQRVFEFMRYCNHPTSITYGATSRGLAYSISKNALESLKLRQAYSIVYTHLGKNFDCRQLIASETQTALRNLEQEYREGRIWVTTTARILDYHHAHQYLKWTCATNRGRLEINIHRTMDPVFGNLAPDRDRLQGLTFYVPDRDRAAVYVDGSEVLDVRRNSADSSGRESVSLPFRPLQFPL